MLELALLSPLLSPRVQRIAPRQVWRTVLGTEVVMGVDDKILPVVRNVLACSAVFVAIDEGSAGVVARLSGCDGSGDDLTGLSGNRVFVSRIDYFSLNE